VSYQDKPVNPTKIDWSRANILDYTFRQKPGPNSNLGKVKFVMPNKRDVLLHDTFPARRKVFQKSMRAVGYGCVRMERPDRFTEVLLAEDKGWSTNEVSELWKNSVNSPVDLDYRIPVHLTYFTAAVDDTGKVATFSDIYRLDEKLAKALFGNPSNATAKPAAVEATTSSPMKPTSVDAHAAPLLSGKRRPATALGLALTKGGLGYPPLRPVESLRLERG
jgi:murein L,D-transpeptidase YcbB/YkuD